MPPDPPDPVRHVPIGTLEMQKHFPEQPPLRFDPGWAERDCIPSEEPPSAYYPVAPPQSDSLPWQVGSHHEGHIPSNENSACLQPLAAPTPPPRQLYDQPNENTVQYPPNSRQHPQGWPAPNYHQVGDRSSSYPQHLPAPQTMQTNPAIGQKIKVTHNKRNAEADHTQAQSSFKRSKSSGQHTSIIDLTSSPPPLSRSQAEPQLQGGFQKNEQALAGGQFIQSSGSSIPSSSPAYHTSTGAESQNFAQPKGRKIATKGPSKSSQKKKKKKTKKEAGEPELCPEQRDLVDLILSGRNVFYTGSAGCGKSTVLKVAVNQLKAMGKEVKIVAPTGRAAVDIGGTTIHAFAGITPDSMKVPLNELVQKAYGRTVYKRFKATDVLVIDEISMVENHLLERVSEMLKKARGEPKKAFGGIQLVMLGDFFQLPPVKPFTYCISCGSKMAEKVAGFLYTCPQLKCTNHKEDFQDEDKWAFRSKCWAEADFKCVNLTSIHRQKNKKFIAILEKCRTGQTLSEKDKDTLLKHRCNVDNAVRLFATREEVRRVNDAEFAKLTSTKLTFQCLDGINLQEHHQQLKWKAKREPDGTLVALREHRFEKSLDLKAGMLVILLVNLDMESGLINGSQGIVVGWEEYDEKKLPKSADPKDLRKDPNPLRPLIFGEYASTKEESIKVFMERAPVKKWPTVKFDNGITRTIMAECTVSELGDERPYSYQCRTQIPLLPAWAMSIHKSQGMTLNKVIVDLARNFEEGQTYVALSRARSLYGLKVESLGRLTRGPNEQVIKFLEEKFGNTEPHPAEEDEEEVEEELVQ